MKKLFLIVLTAVLLLTACHKQSDNAANKTMQTAIATMSSVPTQLYYSGNINPIQVASIVSPDDGNVKQLLFKYGAQVNKGDTVIVVSASKLSDDYHTAVTNYLKAKADYLNAVVNYQGTQALQKAKIISQQDYLSEKNQYLNASLTYIAAKTALEQIIKKIPGLSSQAENLSLDNLDQVTQILQSQHDEILLTAPISGIALYPDQSSSGGSDSSNDSSKQLTEGAAIKQGQVLVSIGDLTGISSTINVSEMAIDKIKPGNAVTITADALPNITFNGVVKSVSAQAQSSQDAGAGGGAATFPVTVVVPTLTPQQAQLIRVGMTDQVQITIENPPQVVIPISAIFEKDGGTMVTVVDPKTNTTHDVPVTTGQTTETDVSIVQGINAGDKVVLHD